MKMIGMQTCCFHFQEPELGLGYTYDGVDSCLISAARSQLD